MIEYLNFSLTNDNLQCKGKLPLQIRNKDVRGKIAPKKEAR